MAKEKNTRPQDVEEAQNEQKEEKKVEKKAEKALKDRIAALEKENSALQEKVDAGKNDYLRLYAEFETFRRRSAQDRIDIGNSAAADTIKGLLPVLDDCERAMALLAESSDEAAKEGTSLIYNKLMAYLKGKGLEPIAAKGEPFDTDFHEAVAQVPVQDEALKGKVYDVIETGYLLGGKVLRYAKVVVGA